MSRTEWTVDRLQAFEESIRQAFLDGKAKGALHLSRGNELQLIEIFKRVKPTDWVFSTWRNHYHALLHGIPEDLVRHEILSGRSISLTNAKHRFFTSSIVGGILPIALGVALGIKRQRANSTGDRFIDDQLVWCFVGDMTAETGIFHECRQYARNFFLPIVFVIEDNEMSTNTPTTTAWGRSNLYLPYAERYYYRREWPHSGVIER